LIRPGEDLFVDSGAWIALALRRDPLHERAKRVWDDIRTAGSRLHTSIPVVLETFTFLDRNATRDVALAWKDSIEALTDLAIHPCGQVELSEAWQYFKRRDLHKLSAVDATSFVIMKQRDISIVFSFDHHFAMVGFRMAG
jgi:uncharacterized protein